MGGKKAAGENTKKVAGNARVCFFLNPAPAIIATSLKHKIIWIKADSAAQKADAAASKKAAEDQKKAADEEKQWSKGSKSSAKKYANSISQR